MKCNTYCVITKTTFQLYCLGNKISRYQRPNLKWISQYIIGLHDSNDISRKTSPHDRYHQYIKQCVKNEMFVNRQLVDSSIKSLFNGT